MRDKITRCIQEIVEQPTGNVYDISVSILGDADAKETKGPLWVPELSELTETKRHLFCDIVAKKTGYRIAMTQDAVVPGTPIILGKNR